MKLFLFAVLAITGFQAIGQRRLQMTERFYVGNRDQLQVQTYLPPDTMTIVRVTKMDDGCAVMVNPVEGAQLQGDLLIIAMGGVITFLSPNNSGCHLPGMSVQAPFEIYKTRSLELRCVAEAFMTIEECRYP